MTFKTSIFGAMAVAAMALSAPAFGHHSFAMFDTDKQITLKGTVTDFQWVNPHGWIMIMVPNAQGQMEQWALEMGAPGQLSRQGWNPMTLQAGDKVSVLLHPLKDGTHGGQYQGVLLPNGKTMGQKVPD